MACEGNAMSDARIGEAVIKEVIEEELRNMSSEDVPLLTTQAVELETEHDKKLVTQLGKMIRIVGDTVDGIAKFQDAIDGVARCSGSKCDSFKQVADNVFEDGITWGRIAVLFYVAGKLAVKMVALHLSQTVKDILKWTVDFFTNNLLGWIGDHGGWINSFSELAVVSARSVSSLSSHSYGLVLIFVTGLTLGSVVTWRLTTRP